MTNQQTPPDWVLIEAAKRSGWVTDRTSNYREYVYRGNPAYRALCDMIERYEQPPVDRKLLCAREALGVVEGRDGRTVTDIAVRAIELWESGYGEG